MFKIHMCLNKALFTVINYIEDKKKLQRWTLEHDRKENKIVLRMNERDQIYFFNEVKKCLTDA
jgi:hypothetical protein